MEQFKYHKEWEDKCRHNLYRIQCWECLFELLCEYEQWKEKREKKSEWNVALDRNQK